ncbi:cellular nucleic acid-binding protein, partial [Trifolium medium]|nr:cellular nucleic acid-binding protein [Trifolium medium]
LEFNRVHINCCKKTVLFPRPGQELCLKLMCCREVTRSLKAQEDVFVMFASLRMKEKSEVDMLPVVREFADVFPDDILIYHPNEKLSFPLT